MDFKWVFVAGLTGSDVMLLQDKSKTVAFRSAAYAEEDRKTKRKRTGKQNVRSIISRVWWI